ncbi:MAG TPA: site-2 protease family protein [Gemmataceae bacterium]|nr:site-2 protease family protein [Gemmataceae bacterium]
MDNHQGRDASSHVSPKNAPPADSVSAGFDDTPGLGAWLARNGLWLVAALALVVLMRFYWHVTLSSLWTIIIIAIGLSAIIFIHELGHFAVAKWCDVHVQTFSIGFGPALPGCRWQWGETTYMIALLPLGGYVKMVGEGPDSEETENDPRSFKNKPVWQRMAIISAGVIMNLVTGFALFVFVYMTHGEERTPSIIGEVEVGSPAWQVGLRPSDRIVQIGDETEPYFDSLKSTVATSGDQPLKLVYQAPGGKPVTTEIVPHEVPGAPSPIIGILPADELALVPAKYQRVVPAPVQPESAAAAATPAFEFGDHIIAMTDPEHPDQVTPLPDDPWRHGWPDYFAFRRRMKALAGHSVTVRVQRGTPGEEQKVDVVVPPAYHRQLGLRMRMGQIAALRADSPAARAGVRAGDIITQVDVNDPAKRGWVIRYVPELHDPHVLEKHVAERELDPVRLPYDLDQWAAQHGADGQVHLKLLRRQPLPDESHRDHNADTTVAVTVPWQKTSPSGLGLAYDVETTVAGVVAGSPAAKAGIHKDDRITAIGFYTLPEKKEGKEPEPPQPPKELIQIPAERPNQWAAAFQDLQRSPVKKMVLKVDRLEAPVTLEAEEARPGSRYGAWPFAERGFIFQPSLRTWKARSFGQALGMGTQRTYDFVAQIFDNLRAVFSGKLSPKNFGGPVMIAKVAYVTASENIYTFLIFMAIISVNLAVMNFLPIPVLDGGHMVFLLYEAVFRRPASERVLAYATVFGLTILLGLMCFVTWHDIVGHTASPGFVTRLYLGM